MSSYTRYIINKILTAVLIVVLISFFCFILIHLMPGVLCTSDEVLCQNIRIALCPKTGRNHEYPAHFSAP